MTNTMEIPNQMDIKKKGDAALIDMLGVAGFARYMELFDNGGEGDYTEEKQAMPIMDLSVDEICSLSASSEQG